MPLVPWVRRRLKKNLKPQQASGAPAIYQANEAYEACEASQSTQAEIFLHDKKQLSLERASML
jgi:hypothetical protein